MQPPALSSSQTSLSLGTEPFPHSAIPSHSSLSSSLPINHQSLHFVFMDSSVLDSETHTICDLLCLASSTQHDVLNAHPRGGMDQYFIPLYGRLLSHRVDGPQFVKYAPTGGHLSCSHLLTVVNTNAINAQVFV